MLTSPLVIRAVSENAVVSLRGVNETSSSKESCGGLGKNRFTNGANGRGFFAADPLRFDPGLEEGWRVRDGREVVVNDGRALEAGVTVRGGSGVSFGGPCCIAI